ncbi:MAG: hypothetical protein E7214_10655 [Clostridium sp.]|nr:hypothetical protein [Clostridium sp.]
MHNITIYLHSIQDKKCINGPYVYKTTIQVAVKNIAYDKKVTVHFYDSFDHKTPWKDTEAHYSYTLRNGYEIWTAAAIHYCPSIRFSLKYEVAGQPYWDNNNGEDYISK